MAKTFDVKTENNEQYQFYPVSNGIVRFKVKAANDAHVVLAPIRDDSAEPIYEIIIGGWRNTKSVIRKNNKQPELAERETKDILSKDSFREFWIRWDGGEVQVGKINEDPFLKCVDPEPFLKSFVGIGTGYGSSGSWIINGKEISTPDSRKCLTFQFLPITSGQLKFDYRGPNNAEICLTTGPEEVEPMLEITLGVDNSKLSVKYRGEVSEEVLTLTPDKIDPKEFRKFEILWTMDSVVLRDGKAKLLMEWLRSVMSPISHFGLRTRSGIGYWRIYSYPYTAPFLRAEPGTTAKK